MPLQSQSGATPISSNNWITKEACNCHITLPLALRKGRATSQSYTSLSASRTEGTAVSLGAAGRRRITPCIKAEQELELSCTQSGNGLEMSARDIPLGTVAILAGGPSGFCYGK